MDLFRKFMNSKYSSWLYTPHENVKKGKLHNYVEKFYNKTEKARS